MAELLDHEDRKQIRAALDDNVVVEAAAGTGKTTELVHRIVAVLAQGRATVDRIVAVTFTEKAAGELKLHLRTQIEEARQRQEEPERGRLEAALARLEEARVGTIHGFCADLLRERSLEAGIDPRFEPLDDTEAQRLFRRAFDSWFETALQNPPEGLRRALRRATRPPAATVRSFGPRPSAAPEDPVGRLRSACWAVAERRDLPAPWARPRFERHARIAALVEALHAFAALSGRCDKPEKDTLFEGTRELRQCSDDVQAAEAVGPRDADGLESLFVELAPASRPRKGYGKSYGPGVGRDEVMSAHEQLRTALLAFARDANADLAALLHLEFQDVLQRYATLKEKSGRLDFQDLLLRARDLVRDCASVRVEFQQRFRHLFVDEFQDTDPLQAEILLLLAARDPAATDWRQAEPAPGKLFLVADPKQSIYRFRGADIGVYFEVRDLLARHGARLLRLSTSFRSVPNIQKAVNTAFAPLLDGDRKSQQAEYVPLAPARPDPGDQPTLIALPVPRPFGKRNVTKGAIDACLPHAVSAFVQWLLQDSGWKVSDREHPDTRVPLAPRHICLLLRRFDSFAGDVTRGYVLALEARDIPHLLVGGRSYHEREEVETLRAALNAIEWPDDELAVFATLHGSLFAIGDEELLEFRQRFGRLHPFRIPAALLASEAQATLWPIAAALAFLATLHRERNTRPIAETLHALLEGTRAHAGFVLRPSGEQVLANVLHLAEQARAYERSGGVSFRGFVERVDEDAERRTATEAPILEEGSDGVRIMTVHKAKGLEFPVVILADITAHLTAREPSRWLDRARGLCAQKLAGWSPAELLEHGGEEKLREAAEGIRIAYVAATRARDLLVVPAVGSESWGRTSHREEDGDTGALTLDSWVAPLLSALYPPPERWDRPSQPPGCPRFGKSSVVEAPMERALDPNVHPGQHVLAGPLSRVALPASPPGSTSAPIVGRIGRSEHEVVWWDPHLLTLDVPMNFGLRQQELLGREADPEQVRRDAAAYRDWAAARQATLEHAATPSLQVQTVTAYSQAEAARDSTAAAAPAGVELVLLPVAPERPRGPRFGTLVHAVLGGIPLDAGDEQVRLFVELQARIVGAPAIEVTAARTLVTRVLQHPLLERARTAASLGHCRRETPVTWRDPTGTLLEGVVDLAFLEDGRWIVVDFKTDHDIEASLPVYTRQVTLYASAITGATGQPARAFLLRV